MNSPSPRAAADVARHQATVWAGPSMAALEERNEGRPGQRSFSITCMTDLRERSIQGREVKPPQRSRRPIPVTSNSAQSVAHAAKLRFSCERCSGCHGRKADGKGPNALDINSTSAQSAQLSGFLEQCDRISAGCSKRSVLYGVQGTAMPAWIDYGSPPMTMWAIVINFIRSLQNVRKSARGRAMPEAISRRRKHDRGPEPRPTVVHTDTTAKWFLVSAVALLLHRGASSLVAIAAKFLLAGSLLGSVSVPYVWTAAPPARQRHAVRLVAGRRYGAGVLHCAAAVRRKNCGARSWAWPRPCHLERDHSGRGGFPAGRVQSRLRIRRTADAAGGAGGSGVGDVRQSTSSCTIATRKYLQMYVSHLVHHGYDSVDGFRLPDRQRSRF